MGATQRWIILPDLHLPFEDKQSVAAVEKYMAAHRWDGWLQLGDFLDLHEISKYVKGMPGTVVCDLERSFEAGRVFLDRQAAILRKRNKKARMAIIEGNHDFRVVPYMDSDPALKGVFDIPKVLDLKKRGVEWVPFWSEGKLFKLGNLYFGHGRWTNKYHAAKHVDHYGVCFAYGHTHDIQESPKVTHGNDKTLAATSLGCLCRYDQSYLRGGPTNWQQAVSTLFLQPNGNYNLYVSRIFRHRFVGPDGVTYGYEKA